MKNVFLNLRNQLIGSHLLVENHHIRYFNRLDRFEVSHDADISLPTCSWL